jgi:hypothetical protein
LHIHLFEPGGGIGEGGRKLGKGKTKRKKNKNKKLKIKKNTYTRR